MRHVTVRALCAHTVLACVITGQGVMAAEVDTNPAGQTITTGIGGSGTTILNAGTINISTNHVNAIL